MRSKSGVRFRPPAVAAGPALAWCLARAFGPPELDLPAVAMPLAGAHALSARLGLSPRIASRLDVAHLAAEVGAGEAELFRRDRFATVATQLCLGAAAEEVATAAAELELPLVFLKYFAMELSGVLAEGSRPAADLDVLVAPDRARDLQRALVLRGYTASRTPEMEHQLPALVAPQGGAVEIHRLVLGVRLEKGAGSATAPGLAVAGLLLPAPGLPGSCFFPAPAVLAAHALVHGLVQHGFAPHAYPALRLVGDWLDLGVEDNGDLLAQAGRLAASEVEESEVAALASLCRRLAAGDLAVLAEPVAESGEAALLHHFLAGVLDESYTRALRFEMIARPLSDQPKAMALGRSLRHAVFPSSAELEAIYGPPRGPWSRAARRLARPFDLVRRALSYARSAISVRLRG